MSGEQRPQRSSGGQGVTLAAERQRVIDDLCEQFARDALTMREFERRLDAANRADQRAELTELLADLPELAQGAAGSGDSGDRGESRRELRDGAGSADSRGVVPVRGSATGRVPAGRVADSQWSLAIWSGRSRRGAWVPARKIRAVACMGGIELDFREALFGTDLVEIHVVALMGGVDIIVPPGVHVDAGGFAFLGGFDEQLGLPGEIPPEAPTIRITGIAIMGGVDVSRRHAGENSRQARARLRQERRRRLESGGRSNT